MALKLVRIVLLLMLLGTSTVLAQPTALDSAAVLHDSHDDLYRTPLGAVPAGTDVTLRLRTAAGDADEVVLFAYTAGAGSQINSQPMEVVATTPEGYDLWETTLATPEDPTLYLYRFIIRKDGESYIYEDDVIGENSVFVEARDGGSGILRTDTLGSDYQLSVYSPDFYTPEWFRNGIIYQIFPDRFRDGDPLNNPEDGEELFYGELPLIFNEVWNSPPVDGRTVTAPSGIGYFNSDFFGGDLQGIIDKLDYIEDLGVNGIYLNPIFLARSNHRYDTVDFLEIDPYLGDMALFRTLVEEAAARDMYIILDGVFNHMSSDSPLFDRYNRFETVGACESVDSEFRSWFIFREPRGAEIAVCDAEGDEGIFYESWFGFDSIPKIDNTLFGPRAYFVRGQDSVARTWGAEGIGGWRLDVAGDIDNGLNPDNNYWELFRTVVRNENPDAVIIGEEWNNASQWLLGEEWDSAMNYRFRRGILGLVRRTDFNDNDGLIAALTPAQFDQLVNAVESDYPPPAYHAMLNLLGSHDTSRAYFVLENDVASLELAALVQYTLPGAPSTYYGDEIAIDAPSQAEGSVLQDDPYNRAPYPWADEEGDTYGPPNEDVLAYYQTLGQMRRDHAALREGEMITLRADQEPGIYAFLRLAPEQSSAAVVVVNTSDEAMTAELELAGMLPSGLNMEAVFSGDEMPSAFTTSQEAISLTVPARTGNVWANADADFVTLPAPTLNDISGSDGAVTLNWEPVADASGYVVYRSPVASGGYTRISDPISETTYTDSAVSNGFVYHYAVASVGENGLYGEPGASMMGVPSQPIESATFAEGTSDETITLAYDATVDVRASVTVEGTTGSGEAARSIRAQAALDNGGESLEWTPMAFVESVDGADLYAAALRPTDAGTVTLRARFSTNAGQSWTEAVPQGDTAPTVIIEAPTDTEAPPAPAELNIVRASLGGVSLAWEPPAADDLAAYQLYRTLEGADTTFLAELDADTTTYEDRSVNQGDTYTYAINAVDNALNASEQTESRSVTIDQGLFPVTFVVEVPENTDSPVFIAGDFGTDALPFWDPAGIELEAVDPNTWAVTLDLPEGANLQYKFARATWDAVEKGESCEEIGNRTVTINNDTLGEPGPEGTYRVEHRVAKWRDLDGCP